MDIRKVEKDDNCDYWNKWIYILKILFSILIFAFIVLGSIVVTLSKNDLSGHYTIVQNVSAHDEVTTMPIQQEESPQSVDTIQNDEQIEVEKFIGDNETTLHPGTNKNKNNQLSPMPKGSMKLTKKKSNRERQKLIHNPNDEKIFQHHYSKKNKLKRTLKNYREDSLFHSLLTQDRVIQEEHFCQDFPNLTPINPFNSAFDEIILQKLVIIRSLSSPESLQNTVSAQYKAACSLLYEDETIDMQASLDFLVERYAFMVFLFATNQDDLVSFMLAFKTCNFYSLTNGYLIGVQCNSEGRIREIRLVRMGLAGEFPSELSHLRMLDNLNLRGNQLKGTIPSELGLLSKLTKLNLRENDLSGTIPSELGNLSNLDVFNLMDNNLNGTIPSEIGKMEMLIDLMLYNNALEGPIPNELFLCKRLTLLDLGNNELNSTIPTFVGQLQNLSSLGIDNNNLSGKFPQQLGNMRYLDNLYLQDNYLSGSLPDVFGNFSRMELLDISNNHFSGLIPESMWDMNNILGLYLDNNDVIGSVPMEFCKKTDLIVFRVDDDSWFIRQPKVECPCCTNSGKSCYLWKRKCPNSNIRRFDFFIAYGITDKVVDKNFSEFVTSLDDSVAEVCLSPTGCYKIEVFADSDAYQDKNLTTLDNLDSNTFDLMSFGDQCNAINICGSIIDQDHPRRAGLNHLTQLVEFDLSEVNQTNSPKYYALCWIMTKDRMFNHYQICDGTLLQRFISATILFQSSTLSDKATNEIKHNLEEKDTCDWKYFECDQNNEYVEYIKMADKKLSGTIMTEIGLLSKLRGIDFSQNHLDGTINFSVYSTLLDLELFDVGGNDLEGEVPFSIVSNPELKKLNISNNRFVGSLPNDVICSKNLEILDLSNNTLQGELPQAIFECRNLTNLDLSQNGFLGKIPEKIETLKDLRVMKLYQNKFTGSIPVNTFNLRELKLLMMHSNKFTGSIPTHVGLLKNMVNITLNHNNLKGPIPDELSKLKKIRHLRLQNNQLIGVAPIIEHFSGLKAGIDYSYVTNCDVSYPLECESCTICCNVDGECQEKTSLKHPIWLQPMLYAFFSPIVIAFVTFGALQVQTITNFSWFQINVTRERITILNEDSVYAFFFADDYRAWSIHIFIFVLQLISFRAFLMATDSREKNSDKALNVRCRGDSLECVKRFYVNDFGWFLYFSITLLYLGKDLAISILQIFKSIEKVVSKSSKVFDLRMLVSGILLQSLTMLGLICSTIYTTAAAETNTDAMGFAVILLFINEMDERAMDLLWRLFPKWTESRMKEVEENIKNRYATQGGATNANLGSNTGTTVQSTTVPTSTQGRVTNVISGPNSGTNNPPTAAPTSTGGGVTNAPLLSNTGTIVSSSATLISSQGGVRNAITNRNSANTVSSTVAPTTNQGGPPNTSPNVNTNAQAAPVTPNVSQIDTIILSIFENFF